MVVDVFQTDRGVLVESADDLRRGDAAVDDVLAVLLELVEDVDGDQEGAQDAEEDEEVVDAQFAPFYLRHDRVLFELPVAPAAEGFRLFQHFEVSFAWTFD